MPRPVGVAALHRGEDVYQSGMIAAASDDLLDSIIFTKLARLANKLDREFVILSDLLRMGADFITKSIRPFRIVKYPNVVAI